MLDPGDPVMANPKVLILVRLKLLNLRAGVEANDQSVSRLYQSIIEQKLRPSVLFKHSLRILYVIQL